MFQTVKAMTVAAMIAAGLPLLTETASAQTAGWNVIRPAECGQPGITGSYLYIFQFDWSFYILVQDEVATRLTKACYDGSPFYAYYQGGAWTYFLIIPGLQ